MRNNGYVNQRSAGFTLLELMLVIAIMALLVSVAAPSWRSFIASQHHSIAVNELIAALRFTRSEAIKSGQRVTACTRIGTAQTCGGEQWSNGWLVFIDSNNNSTREANEKLLKQHSSLHRQVNASGNRFVKKYISYTPLGMARRADTNSRTRGGLQLGTLSVCTSGFKHGHKLVLNRSGRVAKRVKKNCPG